MAPIGVLKLPIKEEHKDRYNNMIDDDDLVPEKIDIRMNSLDREMPRQINIPD